MNKKTNVPLNALIKLGAEKFNVAELMDRNKVLYFPSLHSVIIKPNWDTIKKDWESLSQIGDFVILSKYEAPRQFPELFTNPSAKKATESNVGVTVMLNAEQAQFCRRHGKIATYLRGLIIREMEREKL